MRITETGRVVINAGMDEIGRAYFGSSRSVTESGRFVFLDLSVSVPIFIKHKYILTEIREMSAHSAGTADPGQRISEIIEHAVREAKTKGMRR